MREHEKPHAILTCFSLFFSRVINLGKLIFFQLQKNSSYFVAFLISILSDILCLILGNKDVLSLTDNWIVS